MSKLILTSLLLVGSTSLSKLEIGRNSVGQQAVPWPTIQTCPLHLMRRRTSDGKRSCLHAASRAPSSSMGLSTSLAVAGSTINGSMSSRSTPKQASNFGIAPCWRQAAQRVTRKPAWRLRLPLLTLPASMHSSPPATLWLTMPRETFVWYRSLTGDYPSISNQMGMAASPILVDA